MTSKQVKKKIEIKAKKNASKSIESKLQVLYVSDIAIRLITFLQIINLFIGERCTISL